MNTAQIFFIARSSTVRRDSLLGQTLLPEQLHIDVPLPTGIMVGDTVNLREHVFDVLEVGISDEGIICVLAVEQGYDDEDETINEGRQPLSQWALREGREVWRKRLAG
jgi:hypothetical protein